MQDEGVDRLLIGSFCSIGSGAAFIMAGNQGHRSEWISTFPFYWMPEVPAFAGSANGFQRAGDTVVGNDVWIGSEAIIMPGVSIGDGAVIGTRSVVTRNVAPYAIVGGNPAKVIRSRFEDRAVELLLEMRWWDWSEETLREAMPLITSGDVEMLHIYWKKYIRSTWVIAPRQRNQKAT